MRLTRKFLLALTIVIVVVPAVAAGSRLSRELSYFEWDMRRDAAFTGGVLARAVAKTWQREGPQGALALVRQADLSSRHMRVRWVWLDDPAVVARLQGAPQQKLLEGRTVNERIERSGNHPGNLYTYVPVDVATTRRGALELAESLEEEQTYLSVTRKHVVVETVALVLASGIVATVLGFVFIGRPMLLLVDKARRVGAGDLTGPLALPQKDELGTLALEINTMCENLAQARERVAQEIRARIVAVEQLRHADRLMTVGKLASGIAHELGTPLNVIIGRSQMIADGETEGAEARSSARIIGEQSLRMTRIIRQLLDFARRGSTTKGTLDLRNIASGCASMLTAMATKAGVSLDLRTGEKTVASFADGGQIEQALTNLIVNAIQATPPGGSIRVEVGEEPAAPPADHGGTMGDYLFLRVADTGKGMDPETVSRIFEPFFTTKNVGEGTGLGLSVTYGIARDHGGWIDVESRPGEGSRFTIRLGRALGAA